MSTMCSCPSWFDGRLAGRPPAGSSLADRLSPAVLRRSGQGDAWWHACPGAVPPCPGGVPPCPAVRSATWPLRHPGAVVAVGLADRFGVDAALLLAGTNLRPVAPPTP